MRVRVTRESLYKTLRPGAKPRHETLRKIVEALGVKWTRFDARANGQQLKCLTVIDEYTREALASDIAGSIRSGRVKDALTRLISVHGAPRYLRPDNESEFLSRTILK